MAKLALTTTERAVLEFLNKDGGEFQFNTWAINVDNPWYVHDLTRLKRRGLVGAEGRASHRQWWITDAGKEALRDG